MPTTAVKINNTKIVNVPRMERVPVGTYAERVLIDGKIDQGMLLGLAGDRAAVKAARKIQKDWRIARGLSSSAAVLSTNIKLGKSLKSGHRATLGLQLMPARKSGIAKINVCPWATKCETGCLESAGKGGMSSVRLGRTRRTEFMFEHPFEHGVLHGWEVRAFNIKCGGTSGHRPNTISDLRWELIIPRSLEAMTALGVQVYDYTKSRDRVVPSFYDLTMSFTEETTQDQLDTMINNGERVAVVFHLTPSQPFPAVWRGARVVDGDSHDYRPADESGVVVGLRAKGEMRGDTTGFVQYA